MRLKWLFCSIGLLKTEVFQNSHMPRNQKLQPKSSLQIALLIIALLIGISMIGVAWHISTPRPETDDEIKVRQDAELVRQKEALRQRRELLSRQLQNLVGTEEEANRVAILRAKSSLDDAFTLFTNRVPQFTEEITTWKSRYRIARSGLKDKINGSHELEALASEYFEKHVASNQDISTAIDAIAAQFQSDLAANRNRMLSEAALRIHEADLGIPSADFSAETLGGRIAAKRAQMATPISNIPGATALSISGSIIVEMAVQAMIARVVGYSAGATTTGAAAGAAGGTAFTPGVGTAIGFTVGIAAGFAVDHLMTERMKEKIMRETRDTLNAMKYEIWSNETEGMNLRLEGLVTATKELHTTALTGIAQEGKP